MLQTASGILAHAGRRHSAPLPGGTENSRGRRTICQHFAEFRHKFGNMLANFIKFGSLLAISAPIFASKYSFCSIVFYLQNHLANCCKRLATFGKCCICLLEFHQNRNSFPEMCSSLFFRFSSRHLVCASKKFRTKR